MKKLTIVKKNVLLDALRRTSRDEAWIKQKELEVREGLRAEERAGYPGRGVHAR